MEKCADHSGVCEKIIGVNNRIEQVKEDNEKSFELLRSDIHSMNEKFDKFQNWVYGLLATSFVTIVISIITRFIK